MDNDLLHVLESDMTNSEIANRFNVHIVTVVRWRKKYGIPAKTGRPKYLTTKSCKYCNTQFEPNISGRIFCSHKCRGKFYGTTEKIKSLINSQKENHRTVERGWGQWKRNPNLPVYKSYVNKVHKLTSNIYAKHKDIINPNDYPRTLAGVEGGYHLDHIVSIRWGFDNGWPPEKIACLENLQMLPWRENISKG